MRKVCALSLSALAFSSSLLCEPKSSETIYQDSLKSVFTLYFLDHETLKPKNSCTGFFITDDGLGVTSGPLAKLYQGCKLKVKDPNGDEYEGQLTIYPEAPGIAFIQINGKNKGKIQISKKKFQEGDSAYIFAVHDHHTYFDDLLVTDVNHRWIQLLDDELVNTPVLRTTGWIPNECFGAPLIDEEGNVVAVVINVEMGLGIGYSIDKVKEIFTEEEAGFLTQAWRRLREGIVKRLSKD